MEIKPLGEPLLDEIHRNKIELDKAVDVASDILGTLTQKHIVLAIDKTGINDNLKFLSCMIHMKPELAADVLQITLKHLIKKHKLIQDKGRWIKSEDLN